MEIDIPSGWLWSGVYSYWFGCSVFNGLCFVSMIWFGVYAVSSSRIDGVDVVVPDVPSDCGYGTLKGNECDIERKSAKQTDTDNGRAVDDRNLIHFRSRVAAHTIAVYMSICSAIKRSMAPDRIRVAINEILSGSVRNFPTKSIYRMRIDIRK